MNWIRPILFSALSVIFFTSCQDEDDYGNAYSNALNKNSALTGLVSRVIQNPTAWDDVLDDNSHFSIVLPVSVTVNNQNVYVSESNDGLEEIFDIKNAYNTDDDKVYFQFPITIKYRNYQTQTILNQSEYNALIASLGPCNFLDEISCVHLQYPVVVNAYNSSTEQADSYTFTNNSALYAFLNSLNATDSFNFTYPLSIIDSNANTIAIQSDTQFNQVIEDNIGQCPSATTVNPNPDFNALFTGSSWYVSYCYDEYQDITSYYNGYYFNFYTNGTSKAIKNNNQINGNWSKYPDGNKQKLDLSFAGTVLDHMEEDWEIIEYTTTLIRLRHISGGGSEIDYLYLTKY